MPVVDLCLSSTNSRQDLDFLLNSLKGGIFGKLADGFQYKLFGAHEVKLARSGRFGNVGES